MEPLLTFKSHIEGKNADVHVYADRIEWAKEGHLGRGAKLALGAATLGTSLLKTGVGGKTQGTEMIPIKSISSVTTSKDGLRFMKVSAICSGNTIDFRVSSGEAQRVKDLLTSLVLGSHPAQQGPQPQSYAPPAPAPPPPSAPPAWASDPAGRHEHRWWDGSRWTDQVSDGGVQSVDPI